MARRVDYTPEATADLLAIFDVIARQGGAARAEAYVLRIERRCQALGTFPLGGSGHGQVLAGTRSLGFERLIRIAYRVAPDAVLIPHSLYAGRTN